MQFLQCCSILVLNNSSQPIKIESSIHTVWLTHLKKHIKLLASKTYVTFGINDIFSNNLSGNAKLVCLSSTVVRVKLFNQESSSRSTQKQEIRNSLRKTD